jgi:hypothetical protein
VDSKIFPRKLQGLLPSVYEKIMTFDVFDSNDQLGQTRCAAAIAQFPSVDKRRRGFAATKLNAQRTGINQKSKCPIFA